MMRRLAVLLAALLGAAVLLVSASAAVDWPARTVTTTTLVEAPREDVWRILLDLDDYPDWNPYMRVTGTPTLGGSLAVRLDPAGNVRDLDATVTVLKPPRKLRWQSRVLVPGVLDVEYEVIVAPVTSQLTEVVQRAREEGVAVPVTSAGPSTRGLEQMAAALARRAESGT